MKKSTNPFESAAEQKKDTGKEMKSEKKEKTHARKAIIKKKLVDQYGKPIHSKTMR